MANKKKKRREVWRAKVLQVKMRQMRPKAKQEHFDTLESVTTLEHAAKMVHRDRVSVSYAIDAGYIAFRRVGRIVLISIPSLLDHYNDSSFR